MDNLHHTFLSSATGLESPKSLASDRAFFWIRFHQSAKWLHLFCLQVHDLRFALRFNTSFLFDFKTYCL